MDLLLKTIKINLDGESRTRIKKQIHFISAANTC